MRTNYFRIKLSDENRFEKKIWKSLTSTGCKFPGDFFEIFKLIIDHCIASSFSIPSKHLINIFNFNYSNICNDVQQRQQNYSKFNPQGKADIWRSFNSELLFQSSKKQRKKHDVTHRPLSMGKMHFENLVVDLKQVSFLLLIESTNSLWFRMDFLKQSYHRINPLKLSVGMIFWKFF